MKTDNKTTKRVWPILVAIILIAGIITALIVTGNMRDRESAEQPETTPQIKTTESTEPTTEPTEETTEAIDITEPTESAWQYEQSNSDSQSKQSGNKSKGQKNTSTQSTTKQVPKEVILLKPELLNGGDGEFYMNSKNCLYLYVQCFDEKEPTYVEIYRKAKGDAKYEIISPKRAEKGDSGATGAYKDDSVKPGTVYCYKARTYEIQSGKKKYSPYSDVLVLPALNFKGMFKVISITGAGETEDFIIKLTGDTYNGVLTMYSGYDDDGPFYCSSAKGGTSQNVVLIAYSKDNKTWQSIPKAGVQVKGPETVYLKYHFPDGNNYYSSSEEKTSYLHMYGWADYLGSAGLGGTTMTIDLVEGTAEAFCDYDN